MAETAPEPRERGSSPNWGRELLASVVVFLIALPLCMGIAIASGVPPALGLVTGIVGGLVVGWLAGSPLQVSGPAAGLTVLVWDLVQDHGLAMLGVAVLGAGLLQLAAGAVQVGRWFRAVSPAVIRGMLGGIGVLIFASQFHVMLDDEPRGSGLVNLFTIPQAIYEGLFEPSGGGTSQLAATIGVVTVTLIILWNRFRPSAVRAVPGPLVAVVAAVALAKLASFDVQFVSVPSNLAGNLNLPRPEDFGALADVGFLGATVALALIASAETLLCATAVDRMHDGPRANYDRELMAQGVGNIVCGALGALPMTGVIVRSSANVDAGARTRYSAILHGVWLLLLVAAFPAVLELIPTSSLAAILVFTGYRLLSPFGLVTMWKEQRGEAVVAIATVVAIVATDLLIGVLIGLGLALIKLLLTVSRLEVDIRKEDGAIDVGLAGAATFIRLPVLSRALESLPPRAEVHLHVGGLRYVDHACMDLLRDFQRSHERSGGRVIVEWDDLEERSRQIRDQSVRFGERAKVDSEPRPENASAPSP